MLYPAGSIAGNQSYGIRIAALTVVFGPYKHGTVKYEDATKLTASLLRTALISEIQDFIACIDQDHPLDLLIRKRDNIKVLLNALAEKEVVEYDELVGKYLPNFAHTYLPRTL